MPSCLMSWPAQNGLPLFICSFNPCKKIGITVQQCVVAPGADIFFHNQKTSELWTKITGRFLIGKYCNPKKLWLSILKDQFYLYAFFKENIYIKKILYQTYLETDVQTMFVFGRQKFTTILPKTSWIFLSLNCVYEILQCKLSTKMQNFYMFLNSLKYILYSLQCLAFHTLITVYDSAN